VNWNEKQDIGDLQKDGRKITASYITKTIQNMSLKKRKGDMEKNLLRNVQIENPNTSRS